MCTDVRREQARQRYREENDEEAWFASEDDDDEGETGVYSIPEDTPDHGKRMAAHEINQEKEEEDKTNTMSGKEDEKTEETRVGSKKRQREGEEGLKEDTATSDLVSESVEGEDNENGRKKLKLEHNLSWGWSQTFFGYFLLIFW